MSIFALILALIVLFFAILGLWRGLLLAMISFLAWIAAFIVSAFFASTLSKAASPYIHSQLARDVLSFYVIFFLVLVAGFVIKLVAAMFSGKLNISFGQRLIGLLLGFLQGLLAVWALVFFIYNTDAASADWFNTAPFIMPLIHASQWLKPLAFPAT